MKCPRCEEHVEDHSSYCPHCGEALGHKYCAHCGGGMEKKSSGLKAFVATVIIMFAFGLLVLQFVRPSKAIPSVPGAAPETPATQKPYTIISSVQTTFAGHTLYTIQARVSPYAKQAGILVTIRDVTREKMVADPASIVDVHVYTSESYKTDIDSWSAEGIAVDLDKNPTYQLPGEGFDDVGEHLYVRWKG